MTTSGPLFGPRSHSLGSALDRMATAIYRRKTPPQNFDAGNLAEVFRPAIQREQQSQTDCRWSQAAGASSLGKMKSSTALAKPSSSFEAVTYVAAF